MAELGEAIRDSYNSPELSDRQRESCNFSQDSAPLLLPDICNSTALPPSGLPELDTPRVHCDPLRRHLLSPSPTLPERAGRMSEGKM